MFYCMCYFPCDRSFSSHQDTSYAMEGGRRCGRDELRAPYGDDALALFWFGFAFR